MRLTQYYPVLDTIYLGLSSVVRLVGVHATRPSPECTATDLTTELSPR